MDTEADERLRLICTAEETCQWRTRAGIDSLLLHKARFVDATDGEWFLFNNNHLGKEVVRVGPPTQAKHQDTVLPMFQQINLDKTKAWLSQFCSSQNRYYDSTSGRDAALWLFSQAQALSAVVDPTIATLSVRQIPHAWMQPSIIVRLDPISADASLPIVVLSAHLDSINAQSPKKGRAPGAEDDGSGSATIFEVLRILATTKFQPRRPIEFHWYSGEEEGLLGSQKVVAAYKANRTSIAGVWHADETGYTPKGKAPKIGVSQDHVDKPLSAFLRTLLVEYVTGVTVVDEVCGYACSDHASWTRAGFPATYLFDALMREAPDFTHSEDDGLDKIVWSHLERFVRIGLAFAIELSLS
ncbi:hypothetical protein BC830DRAFT_1065940 [Chytriomyces sp. MP71]|nr:hypothetical protein BC830DRAFT_1065940 [Chytriomyces sp. MP71]